MSAQIDIISERSELGQGSWVRIEEIGKGRPATSDDRYRFFTRSVNLIRQPGANHQRTPKVMFRSRRRFANDLETKTKVKSLLAAGFLLLACDGLGDLLREDTESFRFSHEYF